MPRYIAMQYNGIGREKIEISPLLARQSSPVRQIVSASATRYDRPEPPRISLGIFMPAARKTLVDADYRHLAEFRYFLRLFLSFSEDGGPRRVAFAAAASGAVGHSWLWRQVDRGRVGRASGDQAAQCGGNDRPPGEAGLVVRQARARDRRQVVLRLHRRRGCENWQNCPRLIGRAQAPGSAAGPAVERNGPWLRRRRPKRQLTRRPFCAILPQTERRGTPCVLFCFWLPA